MNRFLFLLIALPMFVNASERALHLSSSLLYHIETNLTNSEESITFTPTEIEALWKRLKSEPLEKFVQNSLKDAYKEYQNENYANARNLLYPIWHAFREKVFNAREYVIPKGHGIHDFDRNPHTSVKHKNLLRPYLISKKHPIKPALDAIFKKRRVTQNSKAFQAAGFRIIARGPRSKVRVASHPTLPGYLLKVYFEDVECKKHKQPYWIWLARRCEGAKKIRFAIKKIKAKSFAVPNKMIYPLPLTPSPSLHECYRKDEILVVDDMKLASIEANLNAWKTKVTKKTLQELYQIITLAGGGSYRPDNIPYNKKGLFVFIDTEYPHRIPDYGKISGYLSVEMRQYWEKLVKQKGKY